MHLLIVNIFLITFLSTVLIFYIIRSKKIIIQKDKTITNNYKTIDKISELLRISKERVVELENGIEKSFGISVRQEVTNVVTDFTKLEMVVLIAGVSKLLKGTSNVEDAEIYIKLTRKIQEFIDNMKEEPLGKKE